MATLTVFAGTNDGLMLSQANDGVGDTYTDARNATGDFQNVGTSNQGNVLAGQLFFTSGPNFWNCYESTFEFDTSSLGADVTISAVALSFYGSTDDSDTDFTAQVRKSSWSPVLTIEDWLTPSELNALTVLATYNTASGWGAGYRTFSESGSNFQAAIEKTSTTQLYVVSSRQVAGNTPTGDERIWAIFANTAGTSQDPKLVITYTEPTVEKTATFDAHLAARTTKTVTFTAALAAIVAKTLDLDAATADVFTQSCTWAAALGATTTKTATFDAVAVDRVLATLDWDSMLEGTVKRFADWDAMLTALFTRPVDWSAALGGLQSGALTWDSLLNTLVAATTDWDAALILRPEKALSFDATLFKTHAVTAVPAGVVVAQPRPPVGIEVA